MLNNLIRVTRWSGTQIIQSESVADHVWCMISLALELIPRINEKRNKLGLRLIDLKELIYKISIHDVGESFYCDIPRPFKNKDEAIHRAIEETEHQLLLDNLIPELVEDIDNAKDTTLEGFYVRVFDFVQAGQKMVNEILLGNQFMLTELPNVIECLEGIKSDIYARPEYSPELEIVDEFLTEFMKVKKHAKENSYISLSSGR